MAAEIWQQYAACWMGSGRYTNPLDSTVAKKWRFMAEGLGIDITMIGFAPGIWPRRFREHAQFILLPQFPLSILRYITVFTLGPLVLLWLIARHNVRLCVAQSPYEGAVMAFCKGLAGVFGCRVWVVVENHTDFERDVFLQRQTGLAGFYRVLMNRAARYALDRADVLRVVSQSTEDQVRQYQPGKPLVRFMAWTDSSAFLNQPRERPVSESYDVVYAGVLIPRKGVRYLIEAFAQLDQPDSQLWLVGKPENADYTAELHALVEQYGLTDRVHFVGPVSQAELARYIGRSRFMVLPSLSEGLGRVVVEAMMVGTPVIGSEVGGIPDMIRPGENGCLVPPGDVDFLLDTMERFMWMDDDIIEAMSDDAREFAQRFFSPEAFVEGHRQMFRLAVEGESHEQA